MDFAETVALAARLPPTLPPLAVDIDGTLTDGDGGLDPRIFPVCRAWPTPLVVATGKSLPYPIGLCEFLNIEPRVIAENGGVVLGGRSNAFRFEGDREAAMAVADAYQDRGYDLGWDEANLVNRWRETEIAVNCDSPLEPLEAVAREHGMAVVDTGYAYHVKSPSVTKGVGLRAIADELEVAPETFAAVGDSENDAAAFDVAGHAIAVSNADETAKGAADRVTADGYADGFLEAVEWLCVEFEA
jgi:phosphoglycolate phosphatase (TIGR01487 family)